MRLARFMPLVICSIAGVKAHAQVPQNAPSQAPFLSSPGGTARTTDYTGARTPGHAPPSPNPDQKPGTLAGDASEPGKAPNEARFLDAHADRVVTLPTAETHPAGTLYFSNYDIAVFQAGYAVSDRTQITLTATPPIGDDGDYVFFLDGTMKTVLAREHRFRLAGLASVTGLAGLEEGNFFLGRFGGVAQFCFESLCHSSLNMGSFVLLGGPATINLTGVGGVWRVSTAVSLLFEANVLVPLGREVGRFNGLAVGPGIRFGWKSFALDAAVEWVADADVDEDERVPAIPLLAVTYRVLP